MQPYKNINGTSNIKSYEYDETSITVEFMNGNVRFYKYTNGSAGSANISHMKQLADRGHGLNSFINTSVKHNFESKW